MKPQLVIAPLLWGACGESRVADLRDAGIGDPVRRLVDPEERCIAGAAPLPEGMAWPVLANAVTLDVEPYSLPQEMTYPPGDDSYWYVVLKAGRIVRFVNDPTTTTFDEVLDISAQVYKEHDQLGLMSLVFHPDFASNGEMFVFYNPDKDPTDPGLVSRVSRFTSTDGGATFDPASEEILLDEFRDHSLHDGGHLEFGSDGYLYIAMGDGGGNYDPHDFGQDPFTLFGSILRIDVDGGVPYAIPPENPYADGILGAPEVIAKGVRNPWQWTFDPTTGALWVGDVGGQVFEEVNYVEIGGNYGWSTAEGPECVDPGCDLTGLTAPAYSYPNTVSAVIGGRVYQGSLLPELSGYYLFSDYYAQWLKGIRRDPITAEFEVIDVTESLGLKPASFAEDLDHEIWLVHRADGAFYTLAPIPANPPEVTLPTRRLSETGCVDPSSPGIPAPQLRPYTVNVELWSDGANKERFLSLPEGSTIVVDDDGDFEFPIGTVIMKHFRSNSQLVETRLLMRHTDGSWAGYTYRWDEDEADAVLVGAEGAGSELKGRTWTFPSRAECMVCHTPQAGFVLGPEVLQLNSFDGGDTGDTGGSPSQLAEWEADGLFSAPLDAKFLGDEWVLPKLSDTDVAAADRAHAYLHANCSICHRPGGSDPDLRFQMGDEEYCRVPAAAGEVFGATVLVEPGAPKDSVVYARIRTVDLAYRMPPLATVLIDSEGAAVVRDWIEDMVDCP